MVDQPFNIYFDLETNCGKDKFVFLENDNHLVDMYAVSYCLILHFHESYHLDKIVIVRSFNDSYKQLGDISTVPFKMLEFRDSVTTSQLHDCIKNVLIKNLTIH